MSELPTVLTEQNQTASAERLLLLLKREGPASLVVLARRMSISKMGVHKHHVNLDGRGLVERSTRGGALEDLG